MNKVVIDFPPGGLGHFLSRVLNNDYNFQAGVLGEFHSQQHSYESVTSSQEGFEKTFELSDKTKNVICLHNFNNTDLKLYFPNHKLINVYLDDSLDIFTNNFYYKAIGSNNAAKLKFLSSIKTKYPDSPNPVREEFCNFHSWLPTSDWAKQKLNYINLPFSYMYNYTSLSDLLDAHKFSIPNNFKKIHDDFLVKQEGIIRKSVQYSEILKSVSDRISYKIPQNFTDVDFGIISSMIYKLTGKDVINLLSINWFSDTLDIIEYGKI
jgi:hypothetical protein